jgi:hypothetical protein
MNRRPRVKVGLRNKTIAERYRICAPIVDAIAALPPEKRKGVRLAELLDARAAAETANEDVHRLTAELNAAISRRKSDLARYCYCVSSTAQAIDCIVGHESEVYACGLSTEKPKLPVPVPDAPTHFRSVPFVAEGAVKLAWKRPCRRCWFIVEMTTDPSATTGWTETRINSLSAAKTIVRGLQPGVLYWFRVRAGNPAGYGPWSQPVSVRPAR